MLFLIKEEQRYLIISFFRVCVHVCVHIHVCKCMHVFATLSPTEYIYILACLAKCAFGGDVIVAWIILTGISFPSPAGVMSLGRGTGSLVRHRKDENKVSILSPGLGY